MYQHCQLENNPFWSLCFTFYLQCAWLIEIEAQPFPTVINTCESLPMMSSVQPLVGSLWDTATYRLGWNTCSDVVITFQMYLMALHSQLLALFD